MTPLLIASIAYLLTTAATICLIRWHLVRMRREVQTLVKAMIEEAVAETKAQARDSVIDAGRAVAEQAVRLVAGSDQQLRDAPATLLQGVLKGIAGATKGDKKNSVP